MRRIKPNEKLSKEHIEKAKHNLKAADYNVQGHFDDWAVSQSYYAITRSWQFCSRKVLNLRITNAQLAQLNF
ncbi:MAG: hypothetical protein KKD18_01300 [Nanoarchaeota archaeon]|nr:hypothetical protein [Nanoarchaeota archaeon]MBU0977030.1 hypothetical protein [Nanoarchaeota archaeon]